MVNLARLLGPSIAGVVIAAAGEGWCFAIDGVSYIAVIVSLLRCASRRQPARPARERHAMSEFVEGLRYAFGFHPIRSVILLLAVVSLVGFPTACSCPCSRRASSTAGRTRWGFS
jgi:hypothetical protein